MAERPHYFGSWCVLFTDAVCLAGAYCLVGTAGSDTMVALSLPIWIVWMSVCYGLLALFLRRPRTTGQLAIVGLSALCSRRCPGFVKLRSFRCLQPALWPGLSVGHTATHHLFTDRALQTPNTHELCGAICFCCAGLSADPAGRHCAARFYNLCILVAVVLCFLYLIGTRLFPNGISSVLFSRGMQQQLWPPASF